jgi:hypothetical protein
MGGENLRRGGRERKGEREKERERENDIVEL